MSQDKPEYVTSELAKNAQKGSNYELGGALIGAIVGSMAAASQQLKGWSFFSKATDITFIGWMVGWVARMWTERSANHHSALQLDHKMLNLEHENKWLKEKVVALGGDAAPEHSENHAEKIRSGRSADEGCGCRFKP